MRPEIVGVPSGSLRRVAPQMTTFRLSAIRMAQPARTSSSRTRTAAAHQLDKAAHVAGPRRQHHFYRYDPPHRSLIPLLLFDTNDGCVGLGRRGNPDADGRGLTNRSDRCTGLCRNRNSGRCDGSRRAVSESARARSTTARAVEAALNCGCRRPRHRQAAASQSCTDALEQTQRSRQEIAW